MIREQRASAREVVIQELHLSIAQGWVILLNELSQYLQGKMMLAHDPFATSELIQCVTQFLRLAHRKVGRALHSVVLALQQRLGAGLLEKRERLGEYPRERRRQQRIEQARYCRSGILDDPEHGTETGTRSRTVLDRLHAKHRPRGGEHLGNRSAWQGDLLPFTVHEYTEELKQT